MEEQAFRRLPARLSGALVHQTPSMLEYKSLASRDMPEFESILIENPEPNGPFGAKEVGQGPLLPMPPAVANAVYDAVRVRVDEVPITPDKVVAALRAKDRRVGPDSFPAVPWPEPLIVPPPWEGGDRSATNEPKRRERASGPRAAPEGKTDGKARPENADAPVRPEVKP
jgi:hypothetical protein